MITHFEHFKVFVSGCALTQKTHPLSSTSLLRPEVSELASAKVMRSRGNELAAQQKDQEAISQLEEAKKLAPQLEGVAHPLAVLYDRNENWNAARREYNQALRESPRDADLWNDYGYFLYHKTKYMNQKALLSHPVFT